MTSAIKAGVSFLRTNDKILKPIIDKVGACNLKVSNNFYLDLIKSIISQQLSAKAARTIFIKLIHKVKEIEPSIIDKLDIYEFRKVGISYQKASFIKGLTTYYLRNNKAFQELIFKTDEEVIEFLCRLNGIGIWTSQMFLIFSLNRLNILPISDIGFKRAIKKNYKLENDDEFEKSILEISKPWGKYKSIAAWYLWKDIDN